MRILNSLALIFLFAGAMRAQISVIAEVDHVKPDGVDTAGNIVLNVSGGTGPYTYVWQPGTFTAKDYTNIAIGTYTVKVKDATSDSVYYYYSLGYKTRWADFYATRFSNDSIIPTYSLPGWMSATSVNTLKPAHDGWMEYILKSTSSYEMFGFADSITTLSGLYSDLDFGFYNNGGSLYYVEHGYFYLWSYCLGGDAIHIERKDTMMNYYQNATYLGSAVVPTTMRSKDWKVHAVLDNASMTNIGCSFADSTGGNYPDYVQNIPFITHCTPGMSDGSISLTPRDGGSRTYTWTTGSTSSSISAQPVGSYGAVTKNANSVESDYTYHIGYKTYWKDLYGCRFIHDSLYPHGGYPGFGTAVSVNTLKPGIDGWVEYVLKTNTDYEMLGFFDSLSVQSGTYYDIDYGLYHAANTLYYIQGGALGYAATCRNGDIIRIERQDTTMNFLVNGNPVVSLVVDPTMRSKPWKLKADLYMEDTDNIGCSFYDSTNTLFPNYVRTFPTFIPESDFDAFDGGVSLRPLYNPRSGTTYSYLWQPKGVTTALYGNADEGTYTVTVTDADSNQTVYNYDVGFRFRLADSTSFNVYTDSIYSYGTWGTALCLDSLKGPLWSEFVVDSIDNMYRMIGFVDTTYVPGNVTDFRYAIYQGQYYVYYIINGSYYLGTYCAKGDVLKIEKTDTLVNFRINNSIFASSVIPSYARSKSVSPKIALYSGSYLARPITSIPAVLAPPYLVLKRKLDGDYYATAHNRLFFTIDGTYDQVSTMNYAVYDFKRAVQSVTMISPSPSPPLKTGDNRFQMDISGLASGYYVLEVENQKKEKLMLRFKK